MGLIRHRGLGIVNCWWYSGLVLISRVNMLQTPGVHGGAEFEYILEEEKVNVRNTEKFSFEISA